MALGYQAREPEKHLASPNPIAEGLTEKCQTMD
jgi:hypothetical protein